MRAEKVVVGMSMTDPEKAVSGREREPLVDFLEGLNLGGLNIAREPEVGRDIESRNIGAVRRMASLP